MKNKTFFCVLLCSISLNIGFIGICGFRLLDRNEPVAPRNCPFITKYTHLYSTLGLSQQQLEAIEPLAEKFHNETKAIGALIVEQRNKLLIEMGKDTVAQGILDAVHRDIAIMQSKLQQHVVSHILEMKDVMTREQREKFFSTMQRSFQTQSFMAH